MRCDASGAIEQFQAAIKVNPKMPDAHFELGYVYWTEKQYANAASELQAELENNPSQTLAMEYLADSKMLAQPGRRGSADA